jgi:hypothetical protein
MDHRPPLAICQSALDFGGREASHWPGHRGPLDEPVAGVRREALIAVATARGPCDLDTIGLGRRSQAEVKTGVAPRQVSASAEPRGDLSPARDGHGHPRADGVAVRGGPLEPEGEEMVWGRSPIAEQGEREVLGDEQQVNAAVVVQVAGRQSTPQPGGLARAPRRGPRRR